MRNQTSPTPWELARLASCADPDAIDSWGAEWLRGVASEVEEIRAAREEGHDLADLIHERADARVPVYTWDRWATFVDLGAWSEDLSEIGDGTSCDMTADAGVALYLIAERLLFALLQDALGEDAAELAYARGVADGTAAGTWVFDGNDSLETVRRTLAGIEEGDPAVLDALPSCPLSGEWAGGLTPVALLADLGVGEDDLAAEEILGEYERGFAEGVETEVVRSARGLL
jgi:hypothetical protein